MSLNDEGGHFYRDIFGLEEDCGNISYRWNVILTLVANSPDY